MTKIHQLCFRNPQRILGKKTNKPFFVHNDDRTLNINPVIPTEGNLPNKCIFPTVLPPKKKRPKTQYFWQFFVDENSRF